MQLRAVVQLARRLAATNVDLSTDDDATGYGFSLRRDDDVLLSGKVDGASTSISVH